jgi:hypothetical protein
MDRKFTNIGSLRVAANGKRKLILAKGITILKDGVEVPLSEFRVAHCIDSAESVLRRQEAGKLDNEKAEKMLNYINEKNIKFDVVIPPATDN